MRGIVLLAGGSGGSYGSGVIDNLWADIIATAVPRTQKSPAYAGPGPAILDSKSFLFSTHVSLPCMAWLFVHYLDGGIPNYPRGTYGESPIARRD